MSGKTSGGKSSGKGAKKPAGNSSGGGSREPAGTYGLKFLTPDALAAAIIGKGGDVIAGMRTACNAKIALTGTGEYFPTSDNGLFFRVLTAGAEDQEALNKVGAQIVDKVAELAKAGGDVSAISGKDGELKLRTLVPKAAVGGIIGKEGKTIKALREDSGANISIADAVGSGPGAEQMVTVSGNSQALKTVLKEINKQIQALNGENWFQNWLAGPSGGYQGVGAAANIQGLATMRGGKSSHGVDTMIQVAQSLPAYVMDDYRGFALSCVVPEKLVGGLIGKGGSGTKEVQNLTGTKISIRENSSDEQNRTLNITGPLANTCTAYMLMMKRYIDAELVDAEKAETSKK